MDALAYNTILLEQQWKKIDGLEATIAELQRRLLVHSGALKDAENDLLRFKAHAEALKNDQGIPELKLTP